MRNYENYINDLGSLERSEFLYLSDNAKHYFSDNFSETEFSYIKRLLKLVAYEDFPHDFDLADVYLTNIYGKICFKNKKHQLCFEVDDALYSTPILYNVDIERFDNIYTNALKSNLAKEKFMLPNKYLKSEFTNYELLSSKDGGVAIAIDNIEIKSMFKQVGSTVDMSELLLGAVESGGRTTETYANQYSFMVKNGFMPVSICKWDDSAVSDEWLSLNGFNVNDDSWKSVNEKELIVGKEDIIFYMYTGGEINLSLKEFRNRTEYSSSYEEARLKRDNLVKTILEGK